MFGWSSVRLTVQSGLMVKRSEVPVTGEVGERKLWRPSKVLKEEGKWCSVAEGGERGLKVTAWAREERKRKRKRKGERGEEAMKDV